VRLRPRLHVAGLSGSADGRNNGNRRWTRTRRGRTTKLSMPVNQGHWHRRAGQLVPGEGLKGETMETLKEKFACMRKLIEENSALVAELHAVLDHPPDQAELKRHAEWIRSIARLGEWSRDVQQVPK